MLPCDQHIRGFGKDALYKSTFCITLYYITLIFDFEQLSYMAGHVINPAIKFENTMPICSWVMRDMHICNYAYNWKCVCGHWASTESRDQWVGGSETITFFGILNPYLPIHYKTYMTTIKSHLCIFQSHVKMVVFRENGGLNIKLWYSDP